MFYLIIPMLMKNAHKQPLSSVNSLHSVGTENDFKGLIWLSRVKFND